MAPRTTPRQWLIAVLEALAYIVGVYFCLTLVPGLLEWIHGHDVNVASVGSGLFLLLLAALPAVFPRTRWRVGATDLAWAGEMLLWYVLILHSLQLHTTHFLFPGSLVLASLLVAITAGVVLILLGRTRKRLRSRARATQVLLLLVGVFHLLASDAVSRRFPRACSELDYPASMVRPLFLFSWCRSPDWASAPLCPYAVSKSREITRLGDRVLGSADTIGVRGVSEESESIVYSIDLGARYRRQSVLEVHPGMVTNAVTIEGSDLVWITRLDVSPTEILGLELADHGLFLRERVTLSDESVNSGTLLADPVARRFVLLPESGDKLPGLLYLAHVFHPLSRSVGSVSVEGLGPLFWAWRDRAIDPARREIFISDTLPGRLFVLDADSLQPTRMRDLDLMSLGVYLDRPTRRLFLPRPFHSEVAILDAGTLEIVGRLPAPYGVRKLSINVGERLLAASAYGSGVVEVWDIDRLERKLTVKLGPLLRAIGTGEGVRAFYAETRCGVFEILVE